MLNPSKTKHTIDAYFAGVALFSWLIFFINLLPGFSEPSLPALEIEDSGIQVILSEIRPSNI